MGTFKNEAEFQKALDRLNAFSMDLKWQPTRARQEHVDAFGIQISYGEAYYRKRVSYNSSFAVKLSRESMEKLLGLTVEIHPAMERIADELLVARRQELHDAVKGLEKGVPA